MSCVRLPRSCFGPRDTIHYPATSLCPLDGMRKPLRSNPLADPKSSWKNVHRPIFQEYFLDKNPHIAGWRYSGLQLIFGDLSISTQLLFADYSDYQNKVFESQFFIRFSLRKNSSITDHLMVHILHH